MTYDEIWGYPLSQIEEFILSRGGLKSGESYQLDRCAVNVDPLPDRIVGSLSFPQTRVRIEGEAAEEFYHQFYLHFLSGGA